MRAKRDGKEGWIPLCAGELTVISTEWARLRKGEVTAVRESERARGRKHDVHYPPVTNRSLSQSCSLELVTSRHFALVTVFC